MEYKELKKELEKAKKEHHDVISKYCANDNTTDPKCINNFQRTLKNIKAIESNLEAYSKAIKEKPKKEKEARVWRDLSVQYSKYNRDTYGRPIYSKSWGTLHIKNYMNRNIVTLGGFRLFEYVPGTKVTSEDLLMLREHGINLSIFTVVKRKED